LDKLGLVVRVRKFIKQDDASLSVSTIGISDEEAAGKFGFLLRSAQI